MRGILSGEGLYTGGRAEALSTKVCVLSGGPGPYRGNSPSMDRVTNTAENITFPYTYMYMGR